MNHAMLLRQRGHLPSPTPPLPLPLLPAPTCLEHLLGRIRKGSLPNGGELRLGWKDSDFLTSPRVVTALKRALKHQPVYTTTCNDNNKSSGTSGSGSYAKTGSSIIRRLSIGWRHNLYHHHYLPNPKKQQPQQQQQRQQQQHEALNATVSRNNSRNGSSNRNQSRTTSSSSNTNNSTMSIPASNGNMMRMTLPPLLPPPSSLSSSTVIEIPPPRLSDNPRRVVLAQFLLTMGRTCPHQLESVQLVLNDWLPMAVLQDFLQHQTSLRTIDFQGVTMLQSPSSSSSSSLLLSNLLQRRRRRPCYHGRQQRLQQQVRGNNRLKPFFRKRTAPIPTTSSTTTSSSNNNNNNEKNGKNTTTITTTAVAVAAADIPRITSVVSILLQQQHLDRHPYLKTIKLIDCDLHNADAIQLADFIHLRGGIAELVLKCNRQLTDTTSVKVLCQAPVMQLLDLSCCDLSPRQGAAMAQALAQRPWVLTKLLLAGNYRLFYDDHDVSSNTNHQNSSSSGSSMALFEAACCEKIRHVDVSHCELTSDVTIQILNALRRLTHYEQHDRRITIRLGQVIMHACHMGNDKAVDALCALLSQQQSSQVNHCHYLQQHKTKLTDSTSTACSNGSTPLSLRVLHLDYPRILSQEQQQHQHALTSSVSVEQLQKIAEQVVHNYHLEELKIDHQGGLFATTTFHHATTAAAAAAAAAAASSVANHNQTNNVASATVLSAHDIWKNMDFYFQLNRAGRRILLLPQPPPPPPPHASRRRKTRTASTTTTTTTCTGLSARGGNSNNRAYDAIDNDGDYNADWYSALAMVGNEKKNNHDDNDSGDDSYSHNTLELLYWMVRHSADRFGHLRA